jgi:hypothetical protein
MHTPVLYEPRFEVIASGEAQAQAELLRALRAISDTTFRDSGQPLRSVHAKSHGLLRAELRVLPDLPPELSQGLFAHPGNYSVILRLSTTPGDVLPDAVSTPRGMALKVLGVRGERLPGSEQAATQDFVLVNSTTFLNAGPKEFVPGLKLLAATTDRVPRFKQAVSKTLRGAERLLEKSGTDSAGLKVLGGHPATHPLGEHFFSQTAFLYGGYMAKFSLAPVTVGLTSLHDVPLDVAHDPDALRHAVRAYFAQQGAEWELRVQLCTNIEEMPIEDASSEWPDHLSPWQPVARIVAPPQSGWSAALSAAIDEGMSFSPWRGLAAHRPLGSVNRVRKAAYEMSAALRAQRRGGALQEPMSLEGLPF